MQIGLPRGPVAADAEGRRHQVQVLHGAGDRLDFFDFGDLSGRLSMHSDGQNAGGQQWISLQLFSFGD